MSKEEAISKIIYQTKWYIGYCSQPYASEIKLRFESGKLSDKKMNEILEFHGMKRISSERWA